MTAAFNSELYRLARRPMVRVLLLIIAVAVLALYLLLWSVTKTGSQGASANDVESLRNSLRVGAVRDFGLNLVFQIGTILVVILTASTVASEFGWGTIRTLLPRATSRTAFLTAKLIAMLLFVALIVVVGFIVALGASALVTGLGDFSGALGSDFVPQTLAAIGRTFYVMLPYMALAFVVALWTRSTAAGIGVTLAVLFLENIITQLISGAGGVLKNAPDALIGHNVSAVLSANSVSSNTGSLRRQADSLPSPWQAAPVLAVYTVIFLALAYWRFRGRDITTE